MFEMIGLYGCFLNMVNEQNQMITELVQQEIQTQEAKQKRKEIIDKNIIETEIIEERQDGVKVALQANNMQI